MAVPPVFLQVVDKLPQLPPYILYGAIGVAVLLGFCLLGALIDYGATTSKATFYPSSGLLYLLMGGMAKKTIFGGSGWKKQARKVGFRLDGQSLYKSLTLEARKDPAKAFKDACSITTGDDTQLPIIYPAALMITPTFQLFCSPDYPFPAIGSVHVTNTTIIRGPLKVGVKYHAVLVVDPEVRLAKRGSEVTFTSTLVDESGESVWVNHSTYLVLHKTKIEAPTPREDTVSLEDDYTVVKEDKWPLVVKDAHRYAAASKDMNPIHQSAAFAKAFGFSGIIIHGMYMLARATEECVALSVGINGSKQSYPVEVSCKFIRPVVLPGEVSFKVYKAKKDPSELRFQIVGKNDKVSVEGSFSSTKK